MVINITKIFRFFSLPLQDRIKVISIENKWFCNIVQQMYQRFKYEQKIRFQLKIEDVSSEEYCIQTFMNSAQPTPYNTSDFNLESFFNIKTYPYISEDKGINENLFLKELRYYSLREQNDTITLSTHLLEHENFFKFFIESFSNGKAFQNYCT
jgi:hypothetical protein